MPPRSTSRKPKASPKLDASMRIVVLHGKEAMLQREHLHEFRQALEQAHGEIDTFTFDGKTAALSDVLDEVRAYSLLGGYKMVVVDDAEPFVKTHRAALERYAENPVDHAALVLKSGVWNKGNLDKKIAKVGALVACEPLKPADATTWLTERAPAHDAKLPRQAATAMVQRLGTDLARLDSELAKLALMAGDKAITPALVEQAVGKSSDEQAWAAQQAVLRCLSQGDGRGGGAGGGTGGGAAIQAVHELIDVAGQPEVLVMYFVSDLMRKFAVASLMWKGGARDEAIGKELKLWGPGLSLFMGVLRRLDTAAAAKQLTIALTLDARAKSGLGEPLRNLERLCLLLKLPH